VTFTSSTAGATFQCKLDSGSFTACTSPQVYMNLVNGAHTVTVHATLGGQTGPDVTRSFTVLDTGPVVTIGGTPANGDYTSSTTTSLTLTSTGTSVTYSCTLDAGSAMPCTSPIVLPTVAEGSHTFSVTGTDGSGVT